MKLASLSFVKNETFLGMFKHYDKLAFSPFLQKFQERQLVNLAFAFTAFLQHFQATAAYKGKLIGGSSI